MTPTILPEYKRYLPITAFALTMAITSPGVNAQGGNNDIGFADFGVCPPGVIDIPLALTEAPVGDQSQLPTNIEADEFETLTDDVVKLVGNAELVQGSRGVYADEITYNPNSYVAEARGNVKFYTSNGDEISAESLEMEVDTFIGTAENVQIKIADRAPYYTEREHYDYFEDYSLFSPFRERSPGLVDPGAIYDGTTYVRARAKAESADFEGKDYEVLHNAMLTTCEQQENADVMLVAKQIELDHSTGIGSAKNMTVKFKKIPIFYFPTVSFPINDERKTGFLFPEFGYEDESGTILGVPYYINIAPTQDATIVPRILSDRGVQLYGEYRYLSQSFRGQLKGEILPSDDIFEDDRHAFSFKHNHFITRKLDAEIDLQTVSDTDYMRDFSSDVDAVSSSYIPQDAKLTFRGDVIRFDARLSAYEAVNSTISESSQPYERLPEINFDIREQDLGMFAYGLDSQYTNYLHDDGTRVDGTRLRIKPYVSLPLEKIYGYIEPKFSLQTISYDLNNNPFPDDSPSVTVPITSIDSGLFFEKLIKRKESIYVQTLEPRLFYVNIPEESEQNEFPDFDTGGGSTSSFSHFFRENRFFGGDRVGDTNQLTLGLTSRIIDDDTGEQRFSMSLGQVFFFEDRVVGLSPDTEPDTDDKSDFLAEFTAAVTADWDFRGFARWDAEDSELGFFQLSADYFHSDRRNASISYSRSEDLGVVSSEQLNFELEAPLGPRWQLDARSDYSLDESEIRSALLGISYDGCCWAASLGMQRYLDGNGNFKNRFLVTFELDDLGRLNTQL